MRFSVRCPKCGQCAKFPGSVLGEEFRCPSCGQRLKIDRVKEPSPAAFAEPRRSSSPSHTGTGVNMPGLAATGAFQKVMETSVACGGRVARWSGRHKAVSVAVVVVVAVLLLSWLPPSRPQPAVWLKISYRDLVDMEQLTQSGQQVGKVLAQSCERGQLQPFLDGFSSLLPEALDMTVGPPDLPRRNVAANYPPGSRQPAWAAIIRGGRIVVTDDGNCRATVFVPGDTPEAAYAANYGLLRHALSALLTESGSALKVSVYAYRNDYATCELALNVKPFVFEAKRFSPPPNKIPLDLIGLQKFFGQGTELSGGKVDDKEGLILVGKIGNAQTLCGQPVEIADLAIAYRAVFCAGDNKAFISLDSNSDPTLATVSFGGFLDDTKLGAVVLEADKRFKTISCGLDPNTFGDLRLRIRSLVPGFATVSERELCFPPDEKAGWKGTRFWYYPDSVEVETSLDYRYAAICSAQFKADAERSREDSDKHLSPAIRANIDDLNQNYNQYAAAYPELNELRVVGRLMGMCVWLSKAKFNQLDLDGLLAVELPAFSTPRTRTQLLSASTTNALGSGVHELSVVQNRSITTYLSPILDKTIAEAFPQDANLAEYLSLTKGAGKEWIDQARKMRSAQGSQKVRSLIVNKKDLEALAEYASGQCNMALPPEIVATKTKIDALKAEIEKERGECDAVEAQLKQLDAIMNRSVADHNQNVDKYNSMVERLRTMTQGMNANIDQYNNIGDQYKQLMDQYRPQVITRISGGIGLEPEKFQVRQVPESPSLLPVKQVAALSGDVSRVLSGDTWIRTRTPLLDSSPKPSFIGKSWQDGNARQTSKGVCISATSGGLAQYWKVTAKDQTIWHDQVNEKNSSARERLYDASKKILEIAYFEQGQVKAHIQGRYDATGRIVFEKSSRRDLISPQSPPSWWADN
jgi:hypothetical protein